MPTSGGMLGEVHEGLLQEALANLGPEWQSQPLPAKIEEAKRRLLMMEKIDQTSNYALDKHQQKVEELNEVQQQLPDMPQVTSKRSIFNIKTAQMMPPEPAPGGVEVQGEPPVADSASGNLPKFNDAAHLRDVLLQIGVDEAATEFGALVSINPELEQAVDDAIGRFFETNDPQRQLELASVIYNSLPQSARSTVNEMEGDTQVSGIEKRVEASNEALRQAAIKLAQKNASQNKTFNMKKLKTAQHKGLENVMMFGPDQVRIDPFTGQLISKWHVYERNKGYGIRMQDALDVDFEAIWRGNIMDKYSQPYRNAEGEWVGGYINKRFEVDRMVPEANNYQLKPGEKRRPYLPEYRSTEARLQHMRSESKEGDHKPTYANKDKPTDWAKDGTEFAPFNFKKAKSKQASSDSKKKSELSKQADFFERFLPKKQAPQPAQPQQRLDLGPIDLAKEPAQPSKAQPAVPQPNVDFNIDDKVEILEHGRPTGLIGYIVSWEGTGFNGFRNQPSARVRIQGVPGGTIVQLTELKKLAQIKLPQGGQPKDFNALPGQEPLKGGPRCSSCGAQLPNPTNVTNQRKGNLTNCPMCNAPLNMGGPWTNPFNQQKQSPFNKNVVIAPNMQRAAQQVSMPTNPQVVTQPEVPSLVRRKKSPAVQVTPQLAIPQTPESVMLSDENADNIDQGHLANVQQSASALGL